MASMSFKLSLLLLFLLWGLKPTFLESCSRVWKWTQSFVFFFFLWILIFLGKRGLTNFQQPGRTVLLLFLGFHITKEKTFCQAVA